VAKSAKESGLKVALSGLGGDELLGGYPSFVDLPRWRRRVRFPAAIPGMGRMARSIMRVVAPGLARRKPKVLGLLEYGSSWAGVYLLRRALFLPSELHRVIDPEVVQSGMHRLKPLRLLASHLAPDPGTDMGRVCALESMHYLRNQLLRDADWAGMAHGVEIRTPFVDFRLLERLAPATTRLMPGEGKAALGGAPAIPLPDHVVKRGKTGFEVPTGVWMKNFAARRGRSVDYGSENKGLISRHWSQLVLGASGPTAHVPEAI
jgi:asparagine synthase (glutamine-hydrolysing)